MSVTGNAFLLQIVHRCLFSKLTMSYSVVRVRVLSLSLSLYIYDDCHSDDCFLITLLTMSVTGNAFLLQIVHRCLFS